MKMKHETYHDNDRNLQVTRISGEVDFDEGAVEVALSVFSGKLIVPGSAKRLLLKQADALRKLADIIEENSGSMTEAITN